MKPQEQKKLEQKIQKILSETLKPKDRILLALSGGPDSIFLFHQLKDFSQNLFIAHLDHGLHPQSSKIQNWLKTLHEEEKSFIKKVNFQKFSEEKGRSERYKFFQKIAEKEKIRFILTAHHADDNLETIIFNLTRGASISGLTGIPKIENNLFRPLLTTTKKEIIEYLKAKKITYKNDPSNKKNIFTRNKIRNKIIPLLQEINPSISRTVSENIEPLEEIENYIQSQATKWLKKNPTITTDNFLKLDKALQRKVLLEIHRQIFGHTRNIENIHISEVIKLIAQKIGNKQKKFGRLTFSLKNHKLHVQKNPN